MSGDGQTTASSRRSTTTPAAQQRTRDAGTDAGMDAAASAAASAVEASCTTDEAVSSSAAVPTSERSHARISPHEPPPLDLHGLADSPIDPSLPFAPHLRLLWRALQQQPGFKPLPLPPHLAFREGAGRGASRRGGGRGGGRRGGEGGSGGGRGEGERERGDGEQGEGGARGGGEERPRVRNWLVQTAVLRRVRVSYVDYGTKVQALTALCYPRFRCDLPLLAVELLCFNSSRLLAFIDLHPTSPQQLHRLTQGNLLPPAVTARLNTIRQQHAHLLTPMTARFFASDSHFFSPHLLLYRSQDGWADANLQPPSGSVWQLLTEYLAAYHDACMACHGEAAGRSAPAAAEADICEAAEGQRAFDGYFERHDPAVNMLGQLFGEQVRRVLCSC
ncbi:unnamed protein product [Closterium sp. Yama58-4]|nr:unnamed protein product [Closterium sp. Yama58-4]